MPTVFLEEFSGLFVAALAEEVGFADGLVGQGSVDGEGSRRQQQSHGENRNTGPEGRGHGEHLPSNKTRRNGSAISGRSEGAYEKSPGRRPRMRLTGSLPAQYIQQFGLVAEFS